MPCTPHVAPALTSCALCSRPRPSRLGRGRPGVGRQLWRRYALCATTASAAPFLCALTRCVLCGVRAGLSAAVLATMVTQPFDVIKTHVQVDPTGRSSFRSAIVAIGQVPRLAGFGRSGWGGR